MRRICFLYLKNIHDTEDVFQEVFMKYVLSDVVFESSQHQRAWIIRVTINYCKDSLKSFFRKKVSNIDDLFAEPSYIPQQDRDVLDAVLRLPENYRNAIYLFYYEGYTAVEISKILEKKCNTIYSWLARGKKLLKDDLGGDSFA